MQTDYESSPDAVADSEGKIDFDYELPPVVDAIKTGWISSSQSAAVVSGLFASTAAQLLSNVRDVLNTEANTKHPHAVSVMLICAYGVLIFASSATITSLILTDQLGAMPVVASKLSVKRKVSRELVPRERTTVKNTFELLCEYGVGRSWSFLMWHWFISLVVGILMMMLEISLYVFLVGEKSVVKYITLAIIVIAVLPLIQFVPFKLRRQK